ncbi:unnamed protein product, partial [Brassica rapa]
FRCTRFPRLYLGALGGEAIRLPRSAYLCGWALGFAASLVGSLPEG